VKEGALDVCMEVEMEVEVAGGGSSGREVQVERGEGMDRVEGMERVEETVRVEGVERAGLGSEGAVSWVSMWPRRNLGGDVMVHRARW
jgi:hypothetical protein